VLFPSATRNEDRPDSGIACDVIPRTYLES
jgi:hypothetical protein